MIVDASAGACRLSRAPRLDNPWQHQAKKCGNVLGPRHHVAPAGPNGQRHPLLSQRNSVIADKERKRSTCIKRYGAENEGQSGMLGITGASRLSRKVATYSEITHVPDESRFPPLAERQVV